VGDGHLGAEPELPDVVTILLTRWVLVRLAIYTLGTVLGQSGLSLIVLAHAAASVWGELEPDRFARLIADCR
jgi:hypothetical protein